MDQTGQGGHTPPPGGQTPPPPPPAQGWQSTPQQPTPPPSGQQGSGMPSWTSNLTAQGTIPGPGGVALADTPNRIIAAVIDFIILGIVGYIVGAIIHPILGERFGVGTVFAFTVPSILSSLVVVLIMLAVTAGYFVYTWTRMDGMTVGNRVLKLSVRDATSGGAVTQSQAINRWLILGAPWALAWFQWGVIGLILSVAVLVWYIYLLITVAQSATRQGFHDQYAKTVVAKVG